MFRSFVMNEQVWYILDHSKDYSTCEDQLVLDASRGVAGGGAMPWGAASRRSRLDSGAAAAALDSSTELAVNTSASTLGISARFASANLGAGFLKSKSPKWVRFALQAAVRELLPDERVSDCLRAPIPVATGIDVFYSPEHRCASVEGLQTCSSVWMCPVCNTRISEKRRVEVQQGVEGWTGQIFLLTLTLQHSVDDAVTQLLDDLQEAARRLRSGRFWQGIKSRYGLVGTIRSLENTYGVNGHHAHQHILCFVSADADVGSFSAELRVRWQEVASRVGRYASPIYGLDVRSARKDIVAYVAKWGKEPRWTAAHELTKAQSKTTAADGSTMLELLAAFAFAGDVQAGRVWRDYALAFKGRKQLVWSPGLRAILGLVQEEKTDEELNNEHEHDAIHLARLTLYEWRVVLANDARAEVFAIADMGDSAALLDFIADLVSAVPTRAICDSG